MNFPLNQFHGANQTKFGVLIQYRRLPMRSLLALISGMILLSACTTHIRPYTPKIRKYKSDKYAKATTQHQQGSLWDETSDSLFTHRRSGRVGDLITVLIRESANAERDAGTDVSRKSEISAGISAFASAMNTLKAAYPSVDPSKLLAASTQNDFSGKGQTTSSGKISATLTARIKQILPNGDLYIEGNKVVMINEEESHLYVSGVVRFSDVQADNTVDSDLIADAQVEYTGRGPVADKQRPGWFSRFFDWISPF